MISDFASGDSGQSYLFASTDTLLCECIATAAVIAENGERARTNSTTWYSKPSVRDLAMLTATRSAPPTSKWDIMWNTFFIF